MELVSCECIASEPIPDKYTQIYLALYTLAQDPTLPTPECVAYMDVGQKLDWIFCASRALIPT